MLLHFLNSHARTNRDMFTSYFSRISLRNWANFGSTLAALSLRSKLSKSTFSSHVAGSTSFEGSGHSNRSTAAHKPHQVLKFNDSLISPIMLLRYVSWSWVIGFPIMSWRASGMLLGEMHRAFAIASSWNLLNTLPKINFLPEVTNTCLLRYSRTVNPDEDFEHETILYFDRKRYSRWKIKTPNIYRIFFFYVFPRQGNLSEYSAVAHRANFRCGEFRNEPLGGKILAACPPARDSKTFEIVWSASSSLLSLAELPRTRFSSKIQISFNNYKHFSQHLLDQLTLIENSASTLSLSNSLHKCFNISGSMKLEGIMEGVLLIAELFLGVVAKFSASLLFVWILLKKIIIGKSQFKIEKKNII